MRTFESNYGRDLGWFVVKEGVAVAALVEPLREDQFWHSYRVEALEGSLPEYIFEPEFWHAADLVFRNRATGEVVRDAFAGDSTPTTERPRVTMRSLHSRLLPTAFEYILLWWRKDARSTRHRA